jgi:uncharacterized protein
MSTPDRLFEAIQQGNTEQVAEMVRENPSLINETTGQGITPILFAAYNNRRNIVDVLLPLKPDLTIFEAAAIGDEQTIKILTVEVPENLSDFSPDGYTPLHLAAFFGHAEIASTLVERGADVNIRANNPTGVMPLHSALAQRDPTVATEIADLLIRKGADVNAAQHGGWRPLHQAAAHGYEEIVRLLLKHGADRLCKSDDGKSPADLAKEKGHQSIVDMLDDA